MPTFHDPLSDAAEASEALRGLAHASRVFDSPADTYTVFGELASGVRSLRQVLDQLATTHLAHQDRAFDDNGNHAAGAADALSAADELHQAGNLLDQAYDRLDAAFSHSGRIAWHPEPTLSESLEHQGATEKPVSRRWISVVFLQGHEADDVLDLIDRDGPDAAIEHLEAFDYGDETTDAALENGYVYDEPPTDALDRVVTEGDYTLTYNPAMGHVSLLRSHTVSPDPALDDADVMPAREAIAGIGALDPSARATTAGTAPARRTSAVAEKDWFAGPARSTTSAGRGLSL
ncbi:hypothetical protein [Brachybacterium sacelli]|uniref:Uncharacterized protein n=1 Tax=Brachybacterium sacelli TaxID=173364 RepID=A0ABS4X7K1_9MICO|nr:hypothetical protein [Brachybacterium sacelli]MBP2383694.1 hypothetical protein [Brachybacterium sacelli]